MAVVPSGFSQAADQRIDAASPAGAHRYGHRGRVAGRRRPDADPGREGATSSRRSPIGSASVAEIGGLLRWHVIDFVVFPISA